MYLTHRHAHHNTLHSSRLGGEVKISNIHRPLRVLNFVITYLINVAYFVGLPSILTTMNN